MKPLLAVKGSRRQRMFIYSQTILLGFLFYWACGFLVEDVGKLPAPEYKVISQNYVPESLSKSVKPIQDRLQRLTTQIDMLTTQRDRLQQSTDSVKATMQQLAEQEKIRLQSSKELTPEQQAAKASSMALFLENQRKDQAITQMIIKLNQQQQDLQSQLTTTNEKIAKLSEPATKKFETAMRTYSLTVASIQIGMLTVILLLAAWLFRRYQTSQFKLIFAALFAASFVQTCEVIHDYFPSAYFKYILIIALIAITIKLLINAIRNADSTQLDVLLKRYRDAYTFFVCPICEFPIRRGPMKFLYWTRRSIANVTAQNVEEGEKESSYTCPVCSTALYTTCGNCKSIRHSLLPSCEHCGDKLPINLATNT